MDVGQLRRLMTQCEMEGYVITDAALKLAAAIEAEECGRWKAALNPVMFADFKCWHQNADAELPEIAAWVIQNLRDRLAEYEGPNAELTGRPLGR